MNLFAKPMKVLSLVFRFFLLTRWLIYAVSQIGLGSVFSKFLTSDMGSALATLFTSGGHPWSDLAQGYKALYWFFGKPALELAILIACGQIVYEHRDIPMRAWRSIRSLVTDLPKSYHIRRRYVRYYINEYEACLDISKVKRAEVGGVTLDYDPHEDIVTATYQGVRAIVGSDWAVVGDSTISFKTIEYDEDQYNRFLDTV